MTALAVHLGWLSTLPDATQHIDVAGVTVPVSVTAEDHGYSVTHMDTGCWGYGETVDDALADCRDMLMEGKAFYIDGPCAHIELPPSVAKRRAAFRAVFQPEGK